MIINCMNLPWPLDKRFINLLQHEISTAGVLGNSGAVASFRDPEYGCATGGYHPVEIAVSKDGHIQYITDFALYGAPPHVELAKEIDFDFETGTFRHMAREFPIRRGRDLYEVWEENFIIFYQKGVYRIEISTCG